MTSLLWLRRDLRRRDHPALLAAREAAGDERPREPSEAAEREHEPDQLG